MNQREPKCDSDSESEGQPISYVARGPHQRKKLQIKPEATPYQKAIQTQPTVAKPSYAGGPPSFIDATTHQLQGHGYNPTSQPGYGYGAATASGNPSVYANNPTGFQPGPAINPINQPSYGEYGTIPLGNSSAIANNPMVYTQVPVYNPSNQPGYGGYGAAPSGNPPAYPNQQASHPTAYQQGQSYPANVPAPNTGYSPYQPPRPAPRGGQGQPRDNSQRY